MGSVRQGGRIALVSVMVGGLVAACGTGAPTQNQSMSTKQVLPLAAYPLVAAPDAYTGALAAASSMLSPWSTNIVGTSPWLGFPTPALAAGILPFPTFAPNIGAAAILNGQTGYLLGEGPIIGGPGPFGLGGGLLGTGFAGGLLGAPGWGGLYGPGAVVSTVMGFPWLAGPIGPGPLAGGAIGAASAIAGVAAGGLAGPALPSVGMGVGLEMGMPQGMVAPQGMGMQNGQMMPPQQVQPAQGQMMPQQGQPPQGQTMPQQQAQPAQGQSMSQGEQSSNNQ